MEFGRTLAVTADGDIALNEQNDAFFLDGPQGVEQELRITLSTIRGEDYFAPDHGLRVFEVATAPAVVLEREISFALEDDDRVDRIQELEVSEPDGTRVRNVDLVVQLVDETVLDFEVDIE